MKFEKCQDCGLYYDRHTRGAHCPHCKDFAWWFYAIGGGLILIALLCAFLLIFLL